MFLRHILLFTRHYDLHQSTVHIIP